MVARYNKNFKYSVGPHDAGIQKEKHFFRDPRYKTFLHSDLKTQVFLQVIELILNMGKFVF